MFVFTDRNIQNQRIGAVHNSAGNFNAVLIQAEISRSDNHCLIRAEADVLRRGCGVKICVGDRPFLGDCAAVLLGFGCAAEADVVCVFRRHNCGRGIAASIYRRVGMALGFIVIGDIYVLRNVRRDSHLNRLRFTSIGKGIIAPSPSEIANVEDFFLYVEGNVLIKAFIEIGVLSTRCEDNRMRSVATGIADLLGRILPSEAAGDFRFYAVNVGYCFGIGCIQLDLAKRIAIIRGFAALNAQTALEAGLVLGRGSGFYDNGAGGVLDHLIVTEALDSHCHVVSQLIVRAGSQDQRKSIRRVCREFPGCNVIFARGSFASVPAACYGHIGRSGLCVSNRLTLAEAGDGHGGVGDGRGGDLEGRGCCITLAFALIRRGGNCVFASISAGNSQFVVHDAESSSRRGYAPRHVAADIFSLSRECCERVALRLAINCIQTALVVGFHGDRSEGGESASYRNLSRLFGVCDSRNQFRIDLFVIHVKFDSVIFASEGNCILASLNFFCACLIFNRKHYPNECCGCICANLCFAIISAD